MPLPKTQLEDGANRLDWPSILKNHDRWLRTIVFARLPEWDAVEDVMQEVSLAAVRQAAPLVDPGKVAPWLYRLAVRQALLYRRGCGRRRRLTERFAQATRPVESDTSLPEPLDWLLASERSQLIRGALERLSPHDAEILLLKYTENWNYHQIASHLGVSHSAIETRLHRARAKLRAELLKLNVIEARR